MRYIDYVLDYFDERHTYNRHQVFDFADKLKNYLRFVVSGDIVDDPPPGHAVVVTSEISSSTL